MCAAREIQAHSKKESEEETEASGKRNWIQTRGKMES